MKAIYVTLLLSLLVLPASADNCKISWCGSNKLSTTEKQICADPTLRAADVFLNRIYKELMRYRGKEGHEGHWPDAVKDEQIAWIKKRNEITEKSKLLTSYMTRIRQIYNWLNDHNNRSIN